MTARFGWKHPSSTYSHVRHAAQPSDSEAPASAGAIGKLLEMTERLIMESVKLRDRLTCFSGERTSKHWLGCARVNSTQTPVGGPSRNAGGPSRRSGARRCKAGRALATNAWPAVLLPVLGTGPAYFGLAARRPFPAQSAARSQGRPAHSGSNCLPLCFSTSAKASSGANPLRYGRSEVMASKVSATATMRARCGMAPPASLSG